MAFTSRIQPLYSTLYLLTFLHLSIFHPSEVTARGYTTHLIHRDSPLSPFYNPSSTHFDLLHDAFHRSFKRVNSINSATEASMIPGGGEYLLKMSLGTPPIEVIGIVDTGSDIIWTQCQPCVHCYNQTIVVFDPNHSSSFNIVPCESNVCQSIVKRNCTQNTCRYKISYADGSYSIGNFAYETLTLGTDNTSISLPNVVFGCSYNTVGIFDKSGSGIIGLGLGNLSLISQTSGSFGKKFSYCLVPSLMNTTSTISFGQDSVVSGSGVVTTPIVIKSPDTFYYLTLEALSVGNERIAFKAPNNVEGNVIIDSGTTFTNLPVDVFNHSELALDKQIGLPRVDDPNGFFDSCYRSVSQNITLPVITIHFKGGDVQLVSENAFSWVKEDVVCFAMVPSSDEFYVYGNLAQMNFLVGFDLEAGTVSFSKLIVIIWDTKLM